VVIELRDVPQGASAVSLALTAADIGLAADEMALEGPLRVELSVYRTGEEIELRGTIRGVAAEECARCAAPVARAFDLGFFVYVKPRPSGGRENGLDADDDLIYHDGRRIDIRGPLRETVLVSAPMAPLCREECRGLCPACGADLNAGPCGCERERSDPRWQTLRGLLGRPPRGST
jgi:uncharacterized protein